MFARIAERVFRPLLHRALLWGLRPPRMPHRPAVTALPRAPSRLRALSLNGARGQRIAAWIVTPAVPAVPPVPAVLALHGWGANASTLWPVVDPLVASGMAVMLIDASCHGDSADEAFMSLPRFAEDLTTALHALRADPAIDPTRIALLGHSVGAAATLLHGAHHHDVRAIVSLAAFAHPAEVMRRWLNEHHITHAGIGEAILAHVQRVIGTQFDAIAPIRLVRRIDCPVLFVHGAGDTSVPLADAQRLSGACPRGELLIVDGDHDLRGALAPHTARIVDFLRSATAARSD
jgi:dipeptidyl aminopeptidase/acylaminoacyl peptidase